MNNSKFFIGYMNKWFAHDDFVIMAETHCERIAEFIKDSYNDAYKKSGMSAQLLILREEELPNNYRYSN